jgi:hypothetical protein
MYLVLLILGAFIAAVGIALTASAISIQDHTFDPAFLTPGVVALVGGTMVFGFGLAVRALGRIEQLLAARSAPRAIHADEVAAAVSVAEQPSNPANQFFSKPAAEARPQPRVPETAAALAPAEEVAPERVREKFPALVRIDTAQVAEETGVSLLPQPQVSADEEVVEVNRAVASRQVNGAAPARTAPRLEAAARTASRPERVKSFDAFWPKRQRPGQQAQTVSVPSAEPALPADAVQSSEPVPEAPPPDVEALATPTPISILKSGVVDGMAYTLYSDGSIEAQLPQGLLRFGSITELRNHIEQGA